MHHDLDNSTDLIKFSILRSNISDTNVRKHLESDSINIFWNLKLNWWMIQVKQYQLNTLKTFTLIF